MTQEQVHELHRAAVKADREFSTALQAEYGSAAGDVRYTVREFPPHIEPLHRTFRDASDRWQRAIWAQRDGEGPACGHSACRQHWIDTGGRECVLEQVGDVFCAGPVDPSEVAVVYRALDARVSR